ncbi:thrombospondin type 3 repeat-containing protein [Streptobacillus felis]|uniref:thrombospondin type 3 repeat-containing protein n=1 Tax=Streptobacillus felis TaxID=1384509 RepID=UPI000832D779|nr:thrombospondin type 3 repeat-containing protein [Streptobacillus felis]
MDSRNRNLMDANLFERADALASIKNKRLYDIQTEDFIKILYSFLERLEALRDKLKPISVEQKEMKNSIEEIIESLEKTIEIQKERTEKEINNELLRDTDLDGLSDREELRNGLDPFDRDTDRDGIYDRDDINPKEADNRIKQRTKDSIF